MAGSPMGDAWHGPYIFYFGLTSAIRNAMGVRPTYLLSFSDTKCVREKRAMDRILGTHRPTALLSVRNW